MPAGRSAPYESVCGWFVALEFTLLPARGFVTPLRIWKNTLPS